MIAASFLAPLLAAAVSVDPKAHSVSFEVVSKDPGRTAPVEFLVAGPDSDHDYESLFVSSCTVKELAEAFAKAGFPMGEPTDCSKAKFWPIGVEVEIVPDVWSLISDTRNERKAPIVYTGGKCGADGVPDAHTNMPQAIFALYDCPQSLFQFDDALGQSDTYGRFIPAAVIPEGEKRTLTVRWKGGAAPEKVELAFKSGNMADALKSLKEKAASGTIAVDVDFSADLTVGEAKQIAAALAVIDSPSVKVDGFRPGQLFYRSFLPLEKWRDRTERLTQPYEVRLKGEGEKPALTIVKEDWSATDALDPKLVIVENASFADLGKEGDLTDTVLVFADNSTKLSEVYALRKLLPGRVVNFYVYGE